MLDKDTKRSPWRLLCLLILLFLIAFLLAVCSNDRFKQSVCNGVCASSLDKKIVLLMNQTNVGNSYLETPYSKLFFKNDENELMTPRDAKWVSTDSDEYVKMKTRGLNPACFSETEYFPPDLNNLILSSAEMVVRVLDFGEDGSLESYDLNIDPFTFQHPNLSSHGLLPNGKVPSTIGNYKSIEYYVSQLTTTQLKSSGSAVTQRVMPSSTPASKTPFHKGFDKNYSGTNGFVYFYVLADDRIKFAEDSPAFYAHIPEAIQTLYSPYFQNKVRLKQTNKPHMLMLHFYRHNAMVADVVPDIDTGNINCNYPYDLAVIADGQVGNVKVETPLLIDPDTEPEGSFP